MNKKLFYIGLTICVFFIGVILVASFSTLDQSENIEDIPFPVMEMDNAIAISWEILNTARGELGDLEPSERQEIVSDLDRLEKKMKKAEEFRKMSRLDPSLLESRQYLLEMETVFEELSNTLDDILSKPGEI